MYIYIYTSIHMYIYIYIYIYYIHLYPSYPMIASQENQIYHVRSWIPSIFPPYLGRISHMLLINLAHIPSPTAQRGRHKKVAGLSPTLW